MRQPLDLWGQRGWCGAEVVGESHHEDAIRKVLGNVGPEWTEIQAKAHLVPEPTNQFDPNAVQVLIDGLLVGYLPREEAHRYAPVLARLIDQGWLPQVSADVRGVLLANLEYDNRDRPREFSHFMGSVRLDLAEPHMLVPANLPPDGEHVVLPRGNAIQVTGEEAYLSALAPLVGPSGETWIHVTLHEVTEQLVRSTRTLVEVRVNGSTAGRLTPKMGGELLPAVRHFADRNMLTAARAILKGNQLKADITLYVARSGDLAQEWLDDPSAAGPLDSAPGTGPIVPGDIAAAETVPAEATPAETTPAETPSAMFAAGAWRFNPPPGWPEPPPGWVPPPGWTAPPGLPPAPEGWQWWLPLPSELPNYAGEQPE